MTMRMPTLLPFGEGRVSGEAIDICTRSIRRGSGHGTSERWFGQSGETRHGEGSGLNVATGGGQRESDRVVGALRPSNAGGAKGPDFWCAFEDGEVKVIGDEPGNTDIDPDPSEKAVS